MFAKDNNLFRKFINVVSRSLGVHGQEQISRWTTVALLGVVPIWIWWYQHKHIPQNYPAGAQIFELTGLGSEGKWTLEPVLGYNYWWKAFSPALIRIEQGDLVVLRLESSDVTHMFYAPTLGIGPVSIEPGHVEVVTFCAEKEGIHEYYCMAVCGDCHFFMRGEIVIMAKNKHETGITSAQVPSACAHMVQAPSDSDLHAKGRYLFQRMGCVSCHGEEGKGGVTNPNYTKGTVPALNTLAQTIALSDQQATHELIKLITAGKTVEEMAAMSTDIPRQSLVLAKYDIVRNVIAKGRDAAKADEKSFEPPLTMPQWEQRLSNRDIDALIVYILELQPWEDYKE